MTLSADLLIPLVSFWLLIGLSSMKAQFRSTIRAKPGADWLLDLIGLGVQGWGVPLLQATLVFSLLRAWNPVAHDIVDAPDWMLLLANLVVVDYLYYWNHRLLHSKRLWALHRVHHSMTSMDVLGTSRNTIYSSLFIVYLWVNGAAVYLLLDPTWWIVGAAITAGLDLWRHSGLGPKRGSTAWRVLSWALVLPADHAWHHSTGRSDVNFGANFSWWDRLHGTWLGVDDEESEPVQLGIDPQLGLARRLLWPFS